MDPLSFQALNITLEVIYLLSAQASSIPVLTKWRVSSTPWCCLKALTLKPISCCPRPSILLPLNLRLILIISMVCLCKGLLFETCIISLWVEGSVAAYITILRIYVISLLSRGKTKLTLTPLSLLVTHIRLLPAQLVHLRLARLIVLVTCKLFLYFLWTCILLGNNPLVV